MAAPAQAPAAARAAITVHACDQQGKKQTFKVNSTTKMQALFDAYAKSEDVDSRCFLFKGSRVHAEQTAADLGLVEGDQLDVELVTGEEAEAAGDDPDLLGNFYLDRLRGDAATRPIWALSRGLAGVVDEASGNYENECSMARPLAALAATCKRARDLCTPGLRAWTRSTFGGAMDVVAIPPEGHSRGTADEREADHDATFEALMFLRAAIIHRAPSVLHLREGLATHCLALIRDASRCAACRLAACHALAGLYASLQEKDTAESKRLRLMIAAGVCEGLNADAKVAPELNADGFELFDRADGRRAWPELWDAALQCVDLEPCYVHENVRNDDCGARTIAIARIARRVDDSVDAPIAWDTDDEDDVELDLGLSVAGGRRRQARGELADEFVRRSAGRLRRELRECVGSVIALAGIALRTATCDLDDQMQRCLCALLAAALRTDGQDDDEDCDSSQRIAYTAATVAARLLSNAQAWNLRPVRASGLPRALAARCRRSNLPPVGPDDIDELTSLRDEFRNLNDASALPEMVLAYDLFFGDGDMAIDSVIASVAMVALVNYVPKAPTDGCALVLTTSCPEAQDLKDLINSMTAKFSLSAVDAAIMRVAARDADGADDEAYHSAVAVLVEHVVSAGSTWVDLTDRGTIDALVDVIVRESTRPAMLGAVPGTFSHLLRVSTDTPRTDAGLLRNLIRVAVALCRLAADSDEASTNLITDSLLALLTAAPPSRDVVYVMARALARGGAFLKGGTRAGVLVASLIKHTTHSPPGRLGLVPLLICDETVEVLLPLLSCADWIQIPTDVGIFEVFTAYPSPGFYDKHDGRLQVRDVAALLLCVRSLRLPDDFMAKFDDDNCWDFGAGLDSADGYDYDDHRWEHVGKLTLEHFRALLDIAKDAGRPSARIVYEFLRYLSQSMMRKDSPEFSKALFVPVAMALKEHGHLAKWGKKGHKTAEKLLKTLMKLGDDCVVVALDAFAEAAIGVQKRIAKRRAARGGGTGGGGAGDGAAEDTAARQAAADQAAADLLASLEAEEHRPGTTKKSRKKGKKASVPAPAPAPAPASAAEVSSSSSSEDDDDDDLLLLAKQQASRSAPAPRARARTKAPPAAAPRAREVNPAMAFASALRGWIVSRGGRIVGTDLAQFYKSPAARGLSVPKGGALKLLRTVAAPAGLRISQDGPRIVISSVGAVAMPPPPPPQPKPPAAPTAPRRALSDLAVDDDDEDDATPARRTRHENADVPRHAVEDLLKLESNAGSITEEALRKLGRLAGRTAGSRAVPADEEKAPDAGPAPSLLPLLTAPAADAGASYALDAPLAALLARLDLNHIAGALAAEEIDIEALPLLSISDLVDIAIKPEDAEKLLVAAVAPPPAAPPPPPIATPSTQECPLCMDGDREIALVPCGHVLCAGCAGRHATESCPMCRQDVASTMRVYF